MKERIIGAVVLVAVVVLVVPVFLDGPTDDGDMVSERVPLPGQSEQKNQTVVLDRDREDPVPVPTTAAGTQTAPDTAAAEPAVAETASAAREPDAEASEPPPQAAPRDPEPATEDDPDRETRTPRVAAAESPAPRPAVTASSTGMWAVQLGSFSNQQNAEKLAADLRKQGFAAFLSQLGTNDGQLHRVRIGPQKDREAAEAMATRLAAAGHRGQVVPHP